MYKAPIKEYERVLRKWASDHEDYDFDTMMEMLAAVSQFCEEALEPTNIKGDQDGVHYDPSDHTVTVSQSFSEVYRGICDNGYTSIALDEEFGGGGAPWVLHHLVSEMMASSNVALTTCPMLTNGAVETLIQNASDELKSLYIDKMVSGRYSGTMCLTEPQCGTDLGLIRTQAKSFEDHYTLSGTKIWITFGEHNLTDNIIHLVLAKTEDAPEGTKGISMFLVPKFLPNGSRNKVFCGGLEEKMGQHGSPTAVINFEDAEAWLVGEEHGGMRAMFQMMNPARIGVGVQALGLSESAYQHALTFAKNRRQSRALDKKLRDTSHDADLILVHPDIRRMLMTIEVTNAAMRRMISFAGYCQDRGDEASLAILTPIIKSYVTEKSMDNISLAMQVMGGMGYVKDGYCEQLYRDGRITMIYEGTNGIQALDLIARKIAKDGGQALMTLLAMLDGGDVDLRKAIDKANGFLLAHAAEPNVIASIAPSYLNLLAIVIMQWLLSQDEDLPPEHLQFYEDYIVPEAFLYLSRVLKGESAMMNSPSFNDVLDSDQNKT